MLNSRRLCLYKLFIDPVGVYWVVEYMVLSYEQREVICKWVSLLLFRKSLCMSIITSVSSFKRKFAVWHVALLVDYLLSMHEALGSSPEPPHTV